MLFLMRIHGDVVLAHQPENCFCFSGILLSSDGHAVMESNVQSCKQIYSNNVMRETGVSHSFSELTG